MFETQRVGKNRGETTPLSFKRAVGGVSDGQELGYRRVQVRLLASHA